ncbi:hypothetical protein BKA62DRAFT_305277 [Auriculariales sp. MPI-PUGE-AT-0066]|nr:hypothetical protein BKA62DRAFT_305277 [Auriculariales sp. MPI-PUGE-AT-0066]
MTPTGRFGIVNLDIIDCQSCGIGCYGRMGLIKHVAGCLVHQQLLSKMEQEWVQRAQRAQRAQAQMQTQEVQKVLDLVPRVLEGMQNLELELYNIFDGNEIIPALPDSMRTRIRSQRHTMPKSYGATFNTEIRGEVKVPAHIIVANVQFSAGNRSAAFFHPRSPTEEKWFEATGCFSTYLMEHESEIEQIYSPDHDFDTIWIIEATIHAASYRQGVVYSSERNGTGTLEMHPMVADGTSGAIHYTCQGHSPPHSSR